MNDSVFRLNSDELKRATVYCAQNWGWTNPPQEVVDRAVLTLRFSDAKCRVGEIITRLNLMPEEKIEQLEKRRLQSKTSMPLIDYIIQNDTEDADFPQHKSNILSYKNGIQYLPNIESPEIAKLIRIHPEMSTPKYAEAANKYKAALILVEEREPVLIFSDMEDYELYQTEGKQDQALNPFRLAYPHLVCATGQKSQILSLLHGEHKSQESDAGRYIYHINLINEDSPARRKLAAIHDYAVRKGASDIHLNPSPFYTEVSPFLRIDTSMIDTPADFRLTAEEYQEVKNFLTNVSGAVKNSTILQKPDDGSYTYKMPDQKLDVRCVFIPTGQDTTVQDNRLYIRLRLLKQDSGPIELDKMKVSKEAQIHMKRAMRVESGMSIMCGPTGSGKSTSLLGMFNEYYKIFGVTKSSVSVEDPVERKVPILNQIQVSQLMKDEHKNPFLIYLKYLLRSDPDLIIIGEMRDSETVEAGGNYANTGHVVLGTLHANDTIKALERITNMLDKDDLKRMIIESLQYIFSQRLLPELCNGCKLPHTLSDEDFEDMKSGCIRAGGDPDHLPKSGFVQSDSGCAKCGNTGVVGPIPINEVLEMTDEVKELIFSSQPNKYQLLRKCRHMNLHDEKVRLVKDGRVSIGVLQ